MHDLPNTLVLTGNRNGRAYAFWYFFTIHDAVYLLYVYFIEIKLLYCISDIIIKEVMISYVLFQIILWWAFTTSFQGDFSLLRSTISAHVIVLWWCKYNDIHSLKRQLIFYSIMMVQKALKHFSYFTHHRESNDTL